MKIIKEGVIPKELMRITCKNCQTVFEFEKYETIRRFEPTKDGYFKEINCPLCRQTVYFN